MKSEDVSDYKRIQFYIKSHLKHHIYNMNIFLNSNFENLRTYNLTFFVLNLKI